MFDMFSAYLLSGLVLGLLLTGVRLVMGPGLADRFVALDMMTVLAIAITALTTLVTGRPEFLDIGLGLAVTGFVATVALAVFLERKESDQ
ncbi:MAG: monovalent cation/H+ antiporter complex subunit F [Caulobacterales bacterium]|uniref:monovalent cation/H+ antiporter complex subunit F n=1 Tax=Glycocaulis sp. TaxID=1969725 RepID=UPI003F9F4346